MGFAGKLFVFVAAFRAGHYGLLLVAIAGVVVSIYYYFGWIRAAYFNDEPALSAETRQRVAASAGMTLRVALAALAAASIVLGFYQGPLGHLVSWH
jgi:NADH-quinone oxidoreductase subunit N